MGDQLVQKPEKPITLNYALELGWPLNDAIYQQLSAKNMGEQYWIKGVYSESDEIFVVLEDYKEGGYVKCGLTITASDTVDLATDSMTKVKMSWSALPAPASAPAASAPAGSTGNTSFKKEGETAMNPEVTPNPALHSAQPPADPAPAPAGEFAEDDDKKCPECGNDPCTCEDDDKDENSKHSKKGTPDYQTMYNVAVAKNLEYETQVANFTAQVAKDAETITALNATIAGYRAQIEAAAAATKDSVMADYAAMLSEDEMKTVTEYAATEGVTAEMVEQKAAVLFSRRAKATPPGQFQLNIAEAAASTGTANLPEFMKQALEYDKDDDLVLKA